LAAGVIHLLNPAPFLSIMPAWVPAPEAVVLWTGLAEILGAIALAQPVSLKLRQAAGWGLAAYAFCVWPANINHFALDMARAAGHDGWREAADEAVALYRTKGHRAAAGRLVDWAAR
jgi:uncharacterized membrane protein